MSAVLPGARRALATDLYQLTMAAGYIEHQEHKKIRATFELFVRKLPRERGFLVVAGIQEAVRYLQELSFSGEEIDFLRGLSVFGKVSPRFWEYLRDFRFTGDLFALPEGTVCFAGEPILRISAPVVEAQLVETYLLAVINFETLIATKAARVVEAAQGREVVEFGTRRAHGPEAGLLAARSAYLAGAHGTSNVEAGMRFGIPVLGTAAHSWTMAHATEEEAFARYVSVFPAGATLLIDTYDTLRGAKRAAAFGERLRGVRLDSGDLLQLSLEVRQILDEAGCPHARIVASGDLNEYSIARLIAGGAKIDTFGVGTELVTSRDAPALGGVYKLVEQEVEGQKHYRAKFSASKATYPGAKQVYRLLDEKGQLAKDVIALAEEPPISGGKALLVETLRGGELSAALPSLEASRNHCREELSRLPPEVKRASDPAPYPVEHSAALEKLFEEVRASLGEREEGRGERGKAGEKAGFGDKGA